MIDRRIGKIKVRRGTEVQRKNVTFESGELVYSIDKQRLFVGDGSTQGGILVSNKNYVVNTVGVPPTPPSIAVEGDIIYDKSSSKTYITRWNDTSNELLLIADANESNRLQIEIDDLYTRLRDMTGCLTVPPPPPPPPSVLTWVIQQSDISINLNQTATFTVSAVGNGNISYEWRRRDGLTVNTSNIHKNTIDILNAGIPDIATYYCVATNQVDSITSRDIILNIEVNSILAEDGTYILSEINEFIDWELNKISPFILKHPESQSYSSGDKVKLSVIADGTNPLSYQWYKDNVIIVGATNSIYNLNSFADTNVGSYKCVVSNSYGTVTSNNAVLTILVPAKFQYPIGITIDSSNNLYIGDYSNTAVRKITQNGIVTTYSTEFGAPEGVALDSLGNLYVCDYGDHVVRKVTKSGMVSVFAGSVDESGLVDGTGTGARFYGLTNLIIDSSDNLYITDSKNHSIRKITSAGVVTTLVGSPAGGMAEPNSITIDSSGNLYVTDYIRHTIYKVTPSGVVSTIAGTADSSGSTDGTGSAASFNGPTGITIDTFGNLYVCDLDNSIIRKITPEGVVTTIAGFAGSTGITDGIGSVARFNRPYGITIDHSNNLYLCDSANHTIRKITPTGVVSTFAGVPGVAGSDNS